MQLRATPSAGIPARTEPLATAAREPWWTRRRALLLVLAIALVTLASRLPALTAEYPFLVHPDEQVAVERACRMVASGDLNPHFLSYPSLCIYLLAAVYAPLDALGVVEVGDDSLAEVARPEHYVVGRGVSLLFSCAGLVVVAAIAMRAVGPLAGVAAALFLATSLLATNQSIQATVNAPLAFFASLTCWAVGRIPRERASPGSFVLPGAFAGLAISAKYLGWPASFLAFVALPSPKHAPKGDRWSRMALCLAAFGAAVLVAFFLTTPFALLDPAAFREDVGVVRGSYSGGFPGNESPGPVSYVEQAGVLVRRAYAPLPLVLAAAGFVWLFATDRRKALLLALYPLLLFAFIGSYRVYFERNLLSAIPFLAVLSSAGLAACAALFARLAGRASSPRVRLLPEAGVAAFALAALLPSLRASSDVVRVSSLPDTREVALEWVAAHLPDGSRILREDHTPVVEELGPRYHVRKIGCLVRPDRRGELEEFDYVIVTRRHYGVLARAPGHEEDTRAYDEFFAAHELVAEFSRETGEVNGPAVLIYACREENAKALRGTPP